MYRRLLFCVFSDDLADVSSRVHELVRATRADVKEGAILLEIRILSLSQQVCIAPCGGP